MQKFAPGTGDRPLERTSPGCARQRFARRGKLYLATVFMLLLSPSPGVADEPYSRFIARTPPLSPAEQRAKFHLPPGFSIELVAAEPDVCKPVNLNFDAAGRLLVTCSVEYPHPAEGAPRDRIVLLSDTSGDGTFDRLQPWAEGLNIPVGVTSVGDELMAYTIDHIVRIAEQEGAAQEGAERAGRGRQLYGPFDFQDTHGMPNAFTYWIDGWVYACHGEGNRSTIRTADGKPVTLDGGCTFRMRPDGSRLERFTQGLFNPFGLCFDPLGNLYAADSHSRPASLLLRGAQYPGGDGPEDALGFAPQIMDHRHDSTGIGGIAYYAAEQFPQPYRSNLLIGNPVTGRINRDRLVAQGSTYKAVAEPDFLVCDDPWFRPVDVQLGPDGAIYIADFYNRIIAHSLVPLGHAKRDRERGRIWRVVYRGADSQQAAASAPNLRTRSVRGLLEALQDPNLLVRVQATQELVDRIGDAAVEPLTDMLAGGCHPWQRVHGLWALERLGALSEDSVAVLADDPQRAVRVHVMHILAQRRDLGGPRGPLHRQIVSGLGDPDAFVRRAAATALAQHRAASNLRPLLQLLEETPAEDRLLRHATRLALRENLRDRDDITELSAELSSEGRRRLADVCLAVATPHAARFLLNHLRRDQPDVSRVPDAIYRGGRAADAETLAELHAYALTFREHELPTQVAVLTALHRAVAERDATIPPAISGWADELARRLISSDKESRVYQGIELAWSCKLTALRGALIDLAEDTDLESPLRCFAIDAFGAVEQDEAVPVLARLLGNAAEPIEVRAKAADTMGKADDAGSRSVLKQQLATAPADLAVAIARTLTRSSAGGDSLLQAVEQGRASRRLLQDRLVNQQLRAHPPADLEERMSRLLRDVPDEDKGRTQLVQQHYVGYLDAAPDPSRGATVYRDHCAACHAIGKHEKGNEAGPPLDGIRGRGVQRVLEDILDPNRNVERRYRSTIVQLNNGRVVSGLRLHEDADTLLLADKQGRPIRIAARDVHSRRTAHLSPMPDNLIEKMSPEDLYDLMAFLWDHESQR